MCIHISYIPVNRIYTVYWYQISYIKIQISNGLYFGSKKRLRALFWAEKGSTTPLENKYAGIIYASVCETHRQVDIHHIMYINNDVA